jgi:hypothetical protein
MTASAPVAEFYAYPRLLAPEGLQHAASHFQANQGLLVLAILAYLVNYFGDLVISWSLYVLLRPVSASLSLLTAWFRLIYTAVAVAALQNLVTLLPLVTTPDYRRAFGPEQLDAQALFLVHAYHYQWDIALVFFGIHLVLLGYLVYRSQYIPRLLGVLLVIAGVGYVASTLGPYLLPRFDFGWLFVTFFGELVFMLWLLVGGPKLHEPPPGAAQLQDGRPKAAAL